MRLVDADKLKSDILELFDSNPEIFNFKARVKLLCLIEDQPTQNSDSGTVLYLCDKRYCEKCNNPDCHYTMDISHAANFEKNECGDYQEKSTVTVLNMELPTLSAADKLRVLLNGIEEEEVFVDGEFLKYVRKSPKEKEQKTTSTPLSMEVDLDKINVNRELEMLQRKEEEEKKEIGSSL